MRLIRLTLEGYRRFADSTSLDTNDRLIALVGPNEAGKTTILRSLTQLNDDQPFDVRDKTLGFSGSTQVVATFTVDADDRTRLADVPGADSLRHFRVVKGGEGQRRFEAMPPLGRDLAPRHAAANALDGISDDPALSSEWQSDEAPWDDALYERVREALAGDARTFSTEQREEFRALHRALAGLHYAPEAPEDESSPLPESDGEGIAGAIGKLQSAIEAEDVEHPQRRANAALASLLPRFEEFLPEDRDLENEYTFDDLLAPTAALGNVAYVAGLDLPALQSALVNNQGADSEELLDHARRELALRFSTSKWRQADLDVRVVPTTTGIQLVVRNKLEKPFTYLGERSSGLQWFVALTCFIERRAADRGVVLLIDEAEQHLHYDAQADLVAFLNAQPLASQVIYSTHSAGCLPPDLGRGVRAVVPDRDPAVARSTIETGFWGEGPGFSRLLLGMGASLLAFTVPRRLLIAEGATEAILLPTLLREATGVDPLPYQVAPGIANTDPHDLPLLATHAGQAVFLVDGDADGRRYARLLRKEGGIDGSKIFDLGKLTGESELNVEELVDPEIYVHAVNDAIATHTANPPILTAAQLPVAKWANYVEKEWCPENGVGAPTKRVVAQRVVDRSRGLTDDGTSSPVVNPIYRDALIRLHDEAMSHFPSLEGSDAP